MFIDTDECIEQPGPCSYKCENTDGAYKCLCPVGQQLLADKKSCAGQISGHSVACIH